MKDAKEIAGKFISGHLPYPLFVENLTYIIRKAQIDALEEAKKIIIDSEIEVGASFIAGGITCHVKRSPAEDVKKIIEELEKKL